MKIMNHKSFSVSRLFTSIVLMFILAACSSNPNEGKVDITTAPSQSSKAYLTQAQSLEVAQQTDWLIMALKADVVEQNYDAGKALVTRLGKLPLNESQQAEWQIARAQMLATTDSSDAALKILNFKPQWKLADNQWARYHTLRAQWLEDGKDFFNADRELIALKASQSIASQAPADITAINQRIWANLNQYSAEEIVQLNAQDNEVELQGWLYVAVEMKTKIHDPMKLQSDLQQWFDANPSQAIVLDTPADVQAILDLSIVAPKNVALLLPLGGKYEKSAKLIRDGFIHAMTDDSSRDPAFTMTVYDTSNTDMAAIYQQMQTDKIDFIVGPLIKDNVEKLQDIDDGAIPMLALNFPDQAEEGMQVCYLTLSPEQEAAQAAKHLFENGFKYPLVLAPKGTLGTRITDAFNTAWAKYSNTPTATQAFGDRAELQANVNKAFGLTESQVRINQIKQIAYMDLETEARSRRDIDSVYIAASRSQLTLIKPFIEVAINPDAKPPKLFSNSLSNNGKVRQYQDVSGIVYSDIPMLINKDDAAAKQYDQLWPNSSNTEKRLHALGMDSYSLINALPTMKVVPGYQANGETGKLSIDSNCVVQRELSWSEHEAFQSKQDNDDQQ
ncbi:YraN family protein [Vibrio sp. S11_S32]|uniref:penicillin-binding protein activator n=1 Tax=Vibrio sp. S11_S32 TaxID=2720225 RepID=UPI0016807EC8|nr:penicillin-binding protein activator [Vibrio sp. S11_S32]MBD1576891.1 YraN family protein [Vibrio sp. S11_S32]